MVASLLVLGADVVSDWKPGKHIATCACTPCRRRYAETIIRATWERTLTGDTQADIDAIIANAKQEPTS